MKAKIGSVFSSHKKLFIFLACGLVLAAAAITTVFLWMNQNKEVNTTASYREYTVAKGDVTVGTSESGTVSLDQTTVSFPVDATIDTVKVKAGYTVKKGDVIVQLNESSIADSTSSTTTKLTQAKLSLQQALADQSSKLKAAQLAYQSSKAKAASAYTQQSITQQEIQNSVTQASDALKAKQSELAKYQSLQSSFSADYAKLNNLKSWRDSAKAQQTSFQNQLSSYISANKPLFDKLDSLKNAQDNAYSALVFAKSQSGANVTAAQAAYDSAKKAYDDYAAYIKSYTDQKSELESKVSLYSAEYQNYSTSYDDYNQTFSQKYGTTNTAALIASKISSLKSDVSAAELSLKKAQLNAQNSLNDADQQLQNSLSAGSSAQSTYDLTVAQLEQAVETQQATYDSLKSQLDDVESAISGNGAITAPCDGIVASVSYTDGSSVKADQAIVTIAKTSSVNMTVSLSEDDISDISIGQAAQISLSSLENQTFDATVVSIASSPARSNSASVTYSVTVKMTADNTEKVLDGMSGDVTFIQKQVKDVLYIPDQAVSFSNGISSVLVKSSDGTQTETTVTTGFSNGRYVEILSGLQEGDTVLAESAVVK